MFHSDFCPYLELKELLPDPSPLSRSRFRSLFTRFYGLNVGGLTDEFKDRFFEILFSDRVIVHGRDELPAILTELSGLKSRKGSQAMPFSFVSKLLATHRDNSPIYDRHVVAFFQEKVPAASVEKQKRIQWFVGFLDRVGTSYTEWARDDGIVPVLNKLKARDSRLTKCDEVRLVDFLVWKAGNQKLLTTTTDPGR